MARLTPQQAAAKWRDRASSASQDYINGINSVTEAPGQKAAAQAQVAKQNYNRAIDSGNWARNVAAVDIGTWKQRATTKGATQYSSGITASADKFGAFMSRFLPQLDQVTAQTNAMPSGTLDQNIARMVNQARGVASLKGKV